MMKFDSKHLPQLEGIYYQFFTKNIPGSSHKYAVKEDVTKEEVEKNQHILASFLPSMVQQMQLLDQVHSNEILQVNHNTIKEIPAADGLVTNLPNIALCIKTSDCVPVIFIDHANRIIAAAHAGWKGAFKNIIRQTISSMLKLGANKNNIIAILGPYIKQPSYEVSRQFLEEFLAEAQDYQQFFLHQSDKIYFDLGAFVKYKLQAEHIKQIHDIDINTYEDPNCFSHRLNTHGKAASYGSLVSTIALI